MKKILFLMLISLISFGQNNSKPRTIVTTDGELDDVDSFVRLLLYSNEFSIEGLIISSSQWHYKGDGKGTKFTSEMDMTKKMYGERTELRWPGTEWIYELVDAYGKVYPNLKKHSEHYPSDAHLKSLIRIGNIDFEGEMEKDTEGSDYIKAKLLDDNMAPLYLQVWGGTNTIARAMKSIEDEYKNTALWESIYKKVCRKAIIYAILDQDATYRKYISVNWPDVKIFYNSNQFWCFAYFWKKAVPEVFHKYLEGDFMGEKVIENHGALTKMYYSYGDGNPPKGEIEDIYSDPEKIKNNQWGSFKKYDFISEGDSPAFLHLVDIGLDNLENPQNGGWGGRLVQSKSYPNRWEDGDPAADYNPYSLKMDKAYAQARWIPVIQKDFAVRADWCIKEFKDANHAPSITIKGKKHLIVKPGKEIKIEVESDDPDGNKVGIKFWQYEEVGTSKEKLIINSKGNTAKLTIPENAESGSTFHVIVEGTDDGITSLTRFQRIVLTVK